MTKLTTLLALTLAACSGPGFTVAAQSAELDAQETGALDIQIVVTDTSPPEAASVGDVIHSPLDALADAASGDDAAPEAMAGDVDASDASHEPSAGLCCLMPGVAPRPGYCSTDLSPVSCASMSGPSSWSWGHMDSIGRVSWGDCALVRPAIGDGCWWKVNTPMSVATNGCAGTVEVCP
jgi:hypothetical protein